MSGVQVSPVTDRWFYGSKGDKGMDAKPGWKTTEFWIALFTQGGAVFAAFQGLLDGTDFAVLMGAATAFYSTSRGIAKVKS